MTLASLMGESFGKKTSSFLAMGVQKLSRNVNFLLESPIRGPPAPAGFIPVVSI